MSATRQIADRVRDLRSARRWSARRLAEECARAGSTSLTRGTIAKIESGVRKYVTADELAVLAQVLLVSPAELLGYLGEGGRHNQARPTANTAPPVGTRPSASMRVYRVFPHLPGATPGSPGHPLSAGEQGPGRLDNPGSYRIWYLALEPEAAIAEAFGDLGSWEEKLSSTPIPGSYWALATYQLDDDIPLLDLDDARNLQARGLRPTQVIERNRAATQSWALSVYNERNDRGARVWQGVRWWSYQRPQWRIIGYWGDRSPQLLAVDELAATHPAVLQAAIGLRFPRSAASPDARRDDLELSSDLKHVSVEP